MHLQWHHLLYIPFNSTSDGCSMQSDTFFLGGQSRGTLDWSETSIGWTALAPCPCDQQSLQMLGASRRCGGDFIQGGVWSPFDPLQTPCSNFSDLTWMICAATEVKDWSKDQLALL